MFTLIVGSFARGPAPMSPSRPQCELRSGPLGRALSLGRGHGRWTSKRRPCITGTEFRVWHDPGAARRGGWQSSPVRPYCGRPGAPRCFTKFQSSGKAIMSDPCMPTRISKEKIGHTLDEEQSLHGAVRQLLSLEDETALQHDDRGLEVREHLDEQPGAHYLFPIRP